jgi:WD40 repeat protein
LGRSRHRTAWNIRFSPDGKRLAGCFRNTICLWDIASGRLLTPKPAEVVSEICAVSVSADGRLLAAADGDGSVGLWELPAHRLRHRFQAGDWILHQIAFSPDGKRLATATGDGPIRLWDTKEGREVGTLLLDRPKGSVSSCLTFSPDGKFIVSAYSSGEQTGGPRGLHVLDVVTGKEIQHLRINDAIINWFVAIAFSAEGRCLTATTLDGETYRWREANGKFTSDGIIFRTSRHASVAYSRNGTLAAGGPERDSITLLEPRTGRKLKKLTGLKNFGRTMAFSPDDRYLASNVCHVYNENPMVSSNSTLQVREIISGREAARWQLPGKTPIRSLTFTPDSRGLVSGMMDSTILIWNLFPADRVKADGMPALWDNLAHVDAYRAHRALGTLLASGDKGVAFLSERLKPARRSERVACLITDLDNDSFAVREKATKELEKQGELAEPALRKVLTERPSLEVRRRIEAILQQLPPEHSPRRLRELRTLQILELQGTPAARRLLQSLAGGVPEALLTSEAKASLRRLASKR